MASQPWQISGYVSLNLSLSITIYSVGDETSYPDVLVGRADLLLKFADENRRLYHLSIPAAVKFYKSSSYKDELCWAALWLYRATNQRKYLQKAKGFYKDYGMSLTPAGMRFSWDDKRAGVQVLMAQVVGETEREAYLRPPRNYCTDIQSGKKVLYTPMGMVYLDEWSPVRYAANAAAICLLLSDLESDKYAAMQNHKWSLTQVDYILGAANNGYSFMIGFGAKYPLRPHHRSSSCPDPPTICNYDYAITKKRNPKILWGAIVGGPARHAGFKGHGFTNYPLRPLSYFHSFQILHGLIALD